MSFTTDEMQQQAEKVGSGSTLKWLSCWSLRQFEHLKKKSFTVRMLILYNNQFNINHIDLFQILSVILSAICVDRKFSPVFPLFVR